MYEVLQKAPLNINFKLDTADPQMNPELLVCQPA